MEIKDKIKFKASVLLSFLIIFIFLITSWAQDLSVNSEAENKEDPKLIVDLDFKDADIKDVARAFSRISQTNIIVSDEVKAKVTLRIQSEDWREALYMVLGAYNITMLEKDNYIIITTVERRRLTEESGDLETRVFGLNFVNVADIQKTLLSMLTSRGRIETDARTNSLVVTDIPERVNKIKEVALELDTKTPQVIIEAMMLTVKLTDDEQLGIDWTLTHKTRPERIIDQDFNLGKAGGLDLKYGKTILPWANLTALLEYWQEEKRVNILANPRVLTLDNLTATIDLTEQVPYTQQVTSTDSASSVSSVQFKDVTISLYVKPHITKDKYIFMNIKTEQSNKSGDTSSTPSQPIIDSRKAETNVMVRDGETIVIGGLRKKEDSTTVAKLPILGDIPWVGNWFKKTIKAKADTELIIFVTPHIVGDSELTEDEISRLGKAEEMKTKNKKAHADKGGLFKQSNVPFPLRPPAAEVK